MVGNQPYENLDERIMQQRNWHMTDHNSYIYIFTSDDYVDHDFLLSSKV